MLDYVRNKTWKYEYKKDGTVVETSYLYVWKVSPPHVYFRLNITEEGSTLNKFVKVDTSSNSDMLRNLQKKKCEKTLELATNSNTLTANIEEARIRVDSDTLSEIETDYRVSSSYPAFFSSLNKKKVKRTLDNDEKVTKTETFDYIITTNAATTQPVSYTDGTIVNKRYCVPKYSAPVAPSTLDVYPFPFELECTTTDTTGPDANGDAVIDFEPDTEL